MPNCVPFCALSYYRDEKITQEEFRKWSNCEKKSILCRNIHNHVRFVQKTEMAMKHKRFMAIQVGL